VESNAENNFVSQMEKNEIFQKAYNEVTKCKSTKLHGNRYQAKNPTRRQLLNAEHEEQICREELHYQEHVELMDAFAQLQEKNVSIGIRKGNKKKRTCTTT
jgi:hypothetical protein